MLLVHRKYQDTQFRPLGLDLPDEFHAALPGHRHVEQQHVELLRANLLQHFVAIAGLADDGEVIGRVQQLLQSLAEDGVIVGDEHADHVRAPPAGIGRRASIVVPLPTAVVIDAAPLSMLTRSRNPTRPNELGLRGS